MSRSAILENQFVGEGYHNLCLRIGELTRLQERTGIGPYMLAQRLADGSWHVADIVETIRLGLIGGGMNDREAFELVTATVKEGTLLDYRDLASNTILAALMGVEDEQLPKEDDGEGNPPAPTSDS